LDRVLDRLWIGSVRDLQAPLGALGFSAALDLRDGQDIIRESDPVHVLRLRNRDGDPWDVPQVCGALDFVAQHLRTGHVLIACAAGMSRSACMAIGFLVRCGWDVPNAYEMVRQARPKIATVPKMLGSVLAAVRL
jgi:protein-tyrosine phosphatase